MSSHATLSAASDDRKARLARLKSLKRKQPEEDNNPEETGSASAPAATEFADKAGAPSPPVTDVARLHLSGRNYNPETRGPKLGFEAPPTLSLDAPTLEEQAADLEEESKRQAAADAQDDKGIDLFKLQPKKPNWDLKRELIKKLEVLNVQTENAIARLVRERLAGKKEAAAVAAAGAQKGGGVDGNSGDGSSAQQGDGDGDVTGQAGLLEGAALVEGMRLREKEEAEELRREQELEDVDLAA
ncbi:cwf18 pre-mRNA splicing factor-domain-containing protein [Apodospora peruviana]|uniref:Cwf18 pre-mRNA splicing factor-domain-containing protein n=1 Tax=Apodospora peruviana TaxID=516989 RepID=A0AAE0MBC7_9PEZI|nr:cwf18 pre-mRNA splicing factor-domain-containing protein [Apodospora peruviana]